MKILFCTYIYITQNLKKIIIEIVRVCLYKGNFILRYYIKGNRILLKNGFENVKIGLHIEARVNNNCIILHLGIRFLDNFTLILLQKETET